MNPWKAAALRVFITFWALARLDRLRVCPPFWFWRDMEGGR